MAYFLILTVAISAIIYHLGWWHIFAVNLICPITYPLRALALSWQTGERYTAICLTVQGSIINGNFVKGKHGPMELLALVRCIGKTIVVQEVSTSRKFWIVAPIEKG